MRRAICIVALTAVVALGACGDDDDNGSDATATTADATTSTAAGPTCSASDLSPTVPGDGTLPEAVAKMRADIARAAVACDYDALAALADRDGEGVSYSFGADDDPIAAWKDAEADADVDPKPLRALRLLLGLRAGKQELDATHTQYAWPVAHTVERPTDAQLQEIADTGLYDMAMLREMISGGSGYLGYRILITADGDWSAFIAGD